MKNIVHSSIFTVYLKYIKVYQSFNAINGHELGVCATGLERVPLSESGCLGASWAGVVPFLGSRVGLRGLELRV